MSCTGEHRTTEQEPHRHGGRRSTWAVRWLVRATGLVALIWFLVRVIPKPSRARYPCQRAALPLASGFVVWLLGAAGVLGALGRARRCLRKARYPLAVAMVAVAVGALSLTLSLSDGGPALIAADPLPANQPVGVAQGVHPGRVVWAHDPEATDWSGTGTGTLWYQHVKQEAVTEMLSESLRALAGEDTDAAAWDALFRHFNRARGRGDVGYRAGEKIAIKTNHVLCASANPMLMAKPWQYADSIGNSPQLAIALLKQLTAVAGVAPADISIGDPSCIMPNCFYHALSKTPGLGQVAYLTTAGRPSSGRMLVRYSEVALSWSEPDASRMEGVNRADHLPAAFAGASYFINLAVLKSHHMNGITLCAKNHYGSLIRRPVPSRRWSPQGHYDLHQGLPVNTPGMGHYRPLVDLMGHRELGGKTLLCVVDGLFAGRNWDSRPERWQMPPFNNDWPSSLFLSQDQVAIDSVGYDFLRAEWEDGYPAMDGATDYMREAALANSPPSGTTYDPEGDGTPLPSLGVHEHWNNPQDKQYSRNLGTGAGIELVAVRVGD